jgi:putative addiction module component (TIGR02574 family)
MVDFFVGLKIRLSFTRRLRYISAMSIDQIAAEALRLPPNERAILAESLWESLMDPFKIPAGTDDDEAIALATERDRQLETGEVKPVSHEEMMARLRR